MKKNLKNISKKCWMAMLAASIMMSSSAVSIVKPVTVYAVDNGVIFSNETIETNNETVDTNNGTIKTNYELVNTNDGTIETNYALVDTNDGTVKTNNSLVDINNGTVTNNHSDGTVRENNGEVTINTGSVQENNGEVKKNTGTVCENLQDGKVLLNETERVDNCTYVGVIEYNYGTVEANGSAGNTYSIGDDSSQTSDVNYPQIGLNYGEVINNYGVTTNQGGTVENNYNKVDNYNFYDEENSETTGMVTNNYGTVANEGNVCNNMSGATVNNLGGTVTNNYGTVQSTNCFTSTSTSTSTITNNYQTGTVNTDKQSPLTIENNFGGSVTADTTSESVEEVTVKNNYDGTVSEGVTVVNEFYSVTMNSDSSNSDVTYSTGFVSADDGMGVGTKQYIQVKNSNGATGSQGTIVLTPVTGYSIEGTETTDAQAAGYTYSIIKNLNGSYNILVSPLTKSIIINPADLKLMITAITPSDDTEEAKTSEEVDDTKTSDDTEEAKTSEEVDDTKTGEETDDVENSEELVAQVTAVIDSSDLLDVEYDTAIRLPDGSLILPNLWFNKEPESVASAHAIAKQIAKEVTNDTVFITIDLGENPGFNTGVVIALCKGNHVEKRCQISYNGKDFELIIPAMDTNSAAFQECMRLFNNEKQPVSFIKFYQIFKKLGVLLIAR